MLLIYFDTGPNRERERQILRKSEREREKEKERERQRAAIFFVLIGTKAGSL